MKVAVIGAGISGLTFVAALKRRAPDIEVAMFERDAVPAFDDAIGMMDEERISAGLHKKAHDVRRGKSGGHPEWCGSDQLRLKMQIL